MIVVASDLEAIVKQTQESIAVAVRAVQRTQRCCHELVIASVQLAHLEVYCRICSIRGRVLAVVARGLRARYL